jgi:hypothetical protein
MQLYSTLLTPSQMHNSRVSPAVLLGAVLPIVPDYTIVSSFRAYPSVFSITTLLELMTSF